MNFTHSRILLLSFLFCCSTGIASAQRFFSVVFNKLPRDMQLYARADDRMADVPISGVIELAGWDHMSVVTFRKQRTGRLPEIGDQLRRQNDGYIQHDAKNQGRNGGLLI